MPSRIAILGAGDVGSALGRKWAEAGHTVAYGVRDASSTRAEKLRQDLGDRVRIGSLADALADSEVALLAVTGSAVAELAATHAAHLADKIVIDATNQRVKGQAEATGEWGEKNTLNSHAVLAAHAAGARYYRAFNSYSWEIFAEPVFDGVAADLFYCGPEGDSLLVVEQLIADIGLNPVRLGGLEQLETADNMLALWAAMAMFQGKGRDKTALKMLHR
jgi:8-hydroxy-5-deazaflavin:NADPH oxidoreductase